MTFKAFINYRNTKIKKLHSILKTDLIMKVKLKHIQSNSVDLGDMKVREKLSFVTKEMKSHLMGMRRRIISNQTNKYNSLQVAESKTECFRSVSSFLEEIHESKVKNFGSLFIITL